LKDISTKTIEDYLINRREKDKVARKTANTELTALSGAFKYAVEMKYLRENPVKGIRRFPKKARKTPRFFDENELKRIIESETRPRYRDIWEFLAFTGLRKGELEHLEWPDVDFKNRVIHVRPKEDWEPKTKLSRTIPMHNRVYKILKERKKANESGRCVFVNDIGRPFKPDDLYSKLKPLLKRLGIEGNVHTFRHTFASHLVMAGVDLPTVASLLGHRDISTTMIYAHLAPEHLVNAVGKLSLQRCL